MVHARDDDITAWHGYRLFFFAHGRQPFAWSWRLLASSMPTQVILTWSCTWFYPIVLDVFLFVFPA